MKTKIIILVIITGAILLLSGCDFFADMFGNNKDSELPKVSDSDQLEYIDTFMQSFLIERTGGYAIESSKGLRPPLGGTGPAVKTTINVSATTYQFATILGVPQTLTDYPEDGLDTTFTVAAAADIGTDIYLVTATTAYPATNIIEEYIEAYYVKDYKDSVVLDDNLDDGIWSNNDPIVDDQGELDPTFRVTHEIHFRDGSTRYETIVDIVQPANEARNGFQAFDIDGALTFPDFSYPTDDPDAEYSSIVIYTHQYDDTAHDYWFWGGTESEDIIGVRYYTEHYVNSDTQYKGTTVAYEKTITNFTTSAGDLADQLEGIFLGSIHTALAESVLRQEVLYDVEAGGGFTPVTGGRITKMRSHVVDVSDQKDFQIQIFDDDAARLLNWTAGTYFIPTGAADEIIAEAPEEHELLVQTTLENPDGDLIPLTSTTLGTSDFAVTYSAIQEGALQQPVEEGDPDVDGDGVVDVYDGETGTSIEPEDFATSDLFDIDETMDMLTEGTFQAWVYLDEHSNYGGIVHKGMQADYKDEEWSLQFWGNKGNVAFAVVQQFKADGVTPQYKYNYVKSAKRLNLQRWYYLAATWDKNTNKINLYIDGVLEKTGSITYNAPADLDPPSPVLVGSQLLEAYKSKTYYGLFGKIDGVKISNTAKSAADISTIYTTATTP
jgi:hypothetical protein